MKQIENQTFDAERALYNSDSLRLVGCRFDGIADGESALKESTNIEADGCCFNLRYPFWHDKGVKITDCKMTESCRAALWYSENIVIEKTNLHGIKALRECRDVRLSECDIISPEFGWSSRNVTVKDSRAESEYFMLRGERLDFSNVDFKGKYSFQYITDSVFEGCTLDTKDAFWHADNVTLKNCTLKGEYLAWYCKNVTLENCTISGTQPFCYCRGLRLINCKMTSTDLAFEKSEVEASITTKIDSIKNPLSGHICVAEVGEIIRDDSASHGEIFVCPACKCK